MDKVPIDLSVSILSYLDIRDLLACFCVSKNWLCVMEREQLWRGLSRELFGEKSEDESWKQYFKESIHQYKAYTVTEKLVSGNYFVAANDKIIKGMFWAAEHGFIGMMIRYSKLTKQGLLSSQGAGQATLLHAAAASGQIHVLNYLLDEGQDVDSLKTDKKTPLMSAAEKGQLETVKHLISRGATVTRVDSSGHTSLWAASRNDRVEVLLYLLSIPEACDKKAIASAVDTAVSKWSESALKTWIEYFNTKTDRESVNYIAKCKIGLERIEENKTTRIRSYSMNQPRIQLALPTSQSGCTII